MLKIRNHIESEIYQDFISKWKNILAQEILVKSETIIDIISSKTVDCFYSLRQSLKANYIDSPYCFCFYQPKCEIDNVIVVNEELCKMMNFYRGEHHAALLHEFGHFYAYNEYGRGIIENNVTLSETLADNFVFKLGMGKELISVLHKMRDSGFYTIDYCKNAINWRIDKLIERDKC